jgi:CRISPR-associated endonuclease Cas1
VLVVEGWGTRLYVRHGVLTVSDGQDQPVHTPRARAKGLRVVVLGRAGTISVEALRWIADAGAVFALIDAAAGRVVCSSVDVGLADARLRRAQALAGVPPSPVGLEIARYLIGKKIAGELWVLENDFSGRSEKANELRDALERTLPKAQTVEKIALIESTCAAVYWSCFTEIELRFARKDAGRVPAHWRKFGTRASAITGGPRLATSAANAVANYLSALAQVECRVALLALGADPALGVIHRDTPARDSFALDLIEVVRPYLESFLLSLITSRVFSKSDFYETQRGVLRVGAGLARQLAETMPGWRQLVAPHAEHVVGLIASSSPLPIRTPTKLTQSKRSAGRDPYRKTEQRKRTRERVAERMIPRRCRDCGVVLQSGQRTYCDECVPGIRIEEFDRARTKATATLAQARAEGRDPAHGGTAATKRAQTLARRTWEADAWETKTSSRPDPDTFVREIFPGLKTVSVRSMAEATGLTRGYCSMIRRGLYVPHARHWAALQALSESDSASKKTRPLRP